MFTKTIAIAIASAGLVLVSAEAQAATFSLGALTPDVPSAAGTVTPGSGTITDDFDFEVATDYLLSAYTNIESGRFEITSDDLTLYATGSSDAIATTGVFDPQPVGQNPTLTAVISPGSYYIQDTFVVPPGHRGDFDVFAGVVPIVSSAPEPAAWALILFGVGAAGAMLRLRPRERTVDRLK